jgi:hypothetical protein
VRARGTDADLEQVEYADHETLFVKFLFYRTNVEYSKKWREIIYFGLICFDFAEVDALTLQSNRQGGRVKLTQQPDPFTGVWTFNAERSTLSTPAPRTWTQWVTATTEEVSVREEKVTADGSFTHHSLQARFDGKEYPVTGFPVAETISYNRLNTHTIAGTGRKNGDVSLNETMTVSEEGTFYTLSYSIYRQGQEVARAVAVFEKARSAG